MALHMFNLLKSSSLLEALWKSIKVLDQGPDSWTSSWLWVLGLGSGSCILRPGSWLWVLILRPGSGSWVLGPGAGCWVLGPGSWYWVLDLEPVCGPVSPVSVDQPVT